MSESDTPRTDEWLAEEKRNPRLSGLGNWLDYCKLLERELTAVRERAVRWEAETWIADEALEQRDQELTAARADLAEIHATGGCSFKELHRVIEQRERLSEALRQAKPCIYERRGYRFDEEMERDEIIRESTEALQSLTTNEQ